MQGCNPMYESSLTKGELKYLEAWQTLPGDWVWLRDEWYYVKEMNPQYVFHAVWDWHSTPGPMYLHVLPGLKKELALFKAQHD